VIEAGDLKFISELSVFAGLDDEALALIAGLGKREEHDAGVVLYREGEPAREMLVVLEGQLNVVKRSPDGGEAVIAILGSGDVAGEMSLIDIQPRSADVRSAGKASVIVLSHGSLAAVYERYPEAYLLLVRNIAREISLRLRRLDEIMASMIFQLRATRSV